MPIRLGSIGDLIVRRPVDVVEDGAGEPPPREFPKIMEVMATAKTHRFTPPRIHFKRVAPCERKPTV